MELRESHRFHRGHTDPDKVSVGDIVIIHSTDQPRGFWKLGKVEKLLVGQDGKNRGAVLRVAGRGRQAKSLSRPIQLLYPLEVSSPHSKTHDAPVDQPDRDIEHSASNEDVSDASPPIRRSRRAAALEARDRLMAQSLADELMSSVDHSCGQGGEDVGDV